jgi:hypothetical protein
MQQDNVFCFNGTEHPNFDCKSALKDILVKYHEYEDKEVSYHSVMNKVRDYFYLLETGMKYKEWVSSL